MQRAFRWRCKPISRKVVDDRRQQREQRISPDRTFVIEATRHRAFLYAKLVPVPSKDGQMKRPRSTEAQIIDVLKEQEADASRAN